ncbi:MULTISPECIES: sensor histidine kinase [unclassified Streptomyces]|uniref:sensor histidine kinase n=1 Tax=unclassified Streptomyces TaxID=2593676 RepID=UPI0038077A81
MPAHICTLAHRRLRSLALCDTPSPRRRHVQDAALAALVTAASCLALATSYRTGLVHSYPVSCLCALIAAASLMWRRTHPEICALVAFAATLTSDEGTSLAAAAYAVGRYGTRWRAPIVGLAAAAYLSTRWLTGELIGSSPWRVYFTGLAFVLPACYGHVIRRQRELKEQLRARLVRAEAATDQVARFALTEKGTRLAFEIHDNVGHHMTYLALRAGAAQRRKGLPPEAARDFEELQEGALTVMRELRGVIDELRAPHGTDRQAPQPDCHEFLAELTRNMRAIGMDAAYSVSGTPRTLAAQAENLLYRVGRESLTNAAKHSPGAPVHIGLAFSADAVSLTIRNGPSPHQPLPVSSGGLGLAGLREAITAAGGHFRAGPLPDGGHQVQAVIPLPHPEKKEPAP